MSLNVSGKLGEAHRPSLGATAVLLGRATLYGVASAGEAGAMHALTILRAEVERTLALMGCENLATLGRSCLRPSGRA